MRWPWRHKEKDDILRVDIRVHLNYRVGALAELITIITARTAIIVDFSTRGADHALGLAESHVDMVLAVRGKLHRDSLLAEIRAAGFLLRRDSTSEENQLKELYHHAR